MAGERNENGGAKVDLGEVLAALIPIAFAVGGILVAAGSL